ncbi:MAG: YchJ family metal-binding protein [Candidatus Margulisiibacteriota bacterium]
MFLCYCGSQINFSACCEPFIQRLELPYTAEQLMRSRYSAYATQNYMYLSETAVSKLNFEPVNELDTLWERLEIINTMAGQSMDSYGEVEFKAFYLEDDKLKYIWEQSQFIKLNDQWVYSTGTILN